MNSARSWGCDEPPFRLPIDWAHASVFVLDSVSESDSALFCASVLHLALSIECLVMLKDDPKWNIQRNPGIAHIPASTPRHRPAEKDLESTFSGRGSEPCLFGDLSEVKNLFKPRPRKSVTLGMARSIKAKVALEKRGLSGFLEGAILSFDGNLPALWTAALHFCESRRLHAPEDLIENATARISWTAFERLEAVVNALTKGEVAGVTRSRVLSGLVELHLRAGQTTSRKEG